MQKVSGESLDLTKQNVKRIKELFPEILTDNEKIDFDMLKTVLGEVVEDQNERYQFTWHGKKQTILGAQQPSKATLRPVPEKSKNFERTENLYLEGDNLEVLKLLQKSYNGKIKMIYIDPPYNTGNDFVYKDNFKDGIQNYLEQTGQVDSDGNLLSSNSESNGRFHTDWLNMMYARLKLAKTLLTDDGVIFISIDDNEVAQLRKICDEIFGEKNFVANISWQRTYSSRNDSLGIVVEVEHILVFSKQPNWSPNKLLRTAEMDSKYGNPDNDDRLWTSSSLTAPGAITHQGMVYAIQHPFTGEMMYPTMGRCWALGQEIMLENMRKWCGYELKMLDDAQKRAEICGLRVDDVRQDVKGIVLSESLESSRYNAQEVLDKGKWPYFYFTNGGKGGIRRKTYLDDMGGRLPTNFWPYAETGHTDEAKKELKALFEGDIPFDTPKPVRLLERILDISTDKDSYVLDFFSGSATTAHAVIKKNAEDGGLRKFILVQLPESSKSVKYNTLCDIGEERIRRAGEKIKTELKEKQQRAGMLDENIIDSESLDTGFKVLKLDTSNIREWNVDFEKLEDELDLYQTPFIDGRSELDIVYEIMLKQGLKLTYPINTFEAGGKVIYDIAYGNLFICLASGIDTDIAKAIIAKRNEYEIETSSVIFSDAGFRNNDSEKLNCIELLKDAGYPEDNLLTI